MATVISIAIEKGGVAKTATTHNLSDALALVGKRVLMLDLDPQRSLTLWAGYSQEQIDQFDARERSIYFAMKGGDPNLMIIGEPASRPRQDGLHLSCRVFRHCGHDSRGAPPRQSTAASGRGTTDPVQ